MDGLGLPSLLTVGLLDMAEKKIVTLGLRIDESTLLKVKGLAELDGITESERRAELAEARAAEA